MCVLSEQLSVHMSLWSSFVFMHAQADVMLQMNDAGSQTTCTCFIYLKPVDATMKLMSRWKQSVMDNQDFTEDQVKLIPSTSTM